MEKGKPVTIALSQVNDQSPCPSCDRVMYQLASYLDAPVTVYWNMPSGITTFWNYLPGIYPFGAKVSTMHVVPYRRMWNLTACTMALACVKGVLQMQ